MCNSGADCFLAILAILFPPIAVWVKRGLCSADGMINIALCFLGYIPGLIHAWYIISTYPDIQSRGYIDPEGGNVYYYTAVYPSQRPQNRPPKPHGPPNPHPQSHSGPQQYGTISSSGPAAGVPTPVQNPQAPFPPPQENNNGEGGSDGPSQPPPSYSDVVKGDNKIQTQD